MGYIVRRASAGRGLFATRNFKRKQRIIEYVGVEVPYESARNSKYLIEVDEHTVIDGTCHTNKARYINHSCNPNAEAYIVGRKVFMYARKNIPAGQEITIDYGADYWNEHIAPVGCRCAPCLSERSLPQADAISANGDTAAAGAGQPAQD